jgi:hypothetical protein
MVEIKDEVIRKIKTDYENTKSSYLSWENKHLRPKEAPIVLPQQYCEKYIIPEYYKKMWNKVWAVSFVVGIVIVYLL